MGDVAEAIETGDDPALALDDNHITDPGERQTLEKTVAAMQRLHSEGRNHIWAYYTRNLVRPVALSQAKVDVIVGNPPWLIYRNTASTLLRTELERQSKECLRHLGQAARHANCSGHIQACSSPEAYRPLPEGWRRDIGMVMPHSALQTGQHAKWRTGTWLGKAKRQWKKPHAGTRPVRLTSATRLAWDLERVGTQHLLPGPCVRSICPKRTGEDGNASATWQAKQSAG